jgi:short-subunit dehydrogenase
MKRILIIGASRGLGGALNRWLPERGDTVWLVSRTQPWLADTDGVARRWIPADLAQPEAAPRIAEALGGGRLDVVIYNAGIWEDSAFGSEYDFERVSPEENGRILTVNLSAAIHCIQRLIPNLRGSDNGKLVFIGSTSGLENIGTREVAYNASKMGLRGAAHALREDLRPDGIGVTIVNPGSFAGEASYETSAEEIARRHNGELVPMQDLVALIKCVVSLTRATVVKEIDVPALGDLGA